MIPRELVAARDVLEAAMRNDFDTFVDECGARSMCMFTCMGYNCLVFVRKAGDNIEFPFDILHDAEARAKAAEMLKGAV